MARNFREALRLSPFRWVGTAPGFSEAFNEFIKSENVPIRSWDRITKTWWFPEHYEGVVRDKLQSLNLIHPDAAAEWVRQFYFRGAKNLNQTEKQQRRAALLELGLDPDSTPPRDFVRQVYGYWKQRWMQEGVFTRLKELEDAYAYLEAEADRIIATERREASR